MGTVIQKATAIVQLRHERPIRFAVTVIVTVTAIVRLTVSVTAIKTNCNCNSHRKTNCNCSSHADIDGSSGVLRLKHRITL